MAAVAVAATGDRAAALASMADAERAFARAAGTRGIRAAFLEYLDDNAVGFDDGIGRAKDTWRARSEPADPLANGLEWEPRTGDVSADGTLGWLAGPYVFVPGRDRSKAVYGCYFSVWRRAPDGPWRVYIDFGISTPAPCAFSASFEALPPVPRPATPLARDTLLDADRAFAARVKAAGIGTAFAAVDSELVRVHRDGHQPAVGRDAARAAVSGDPGPWAFTPIDGAVASSGDLGFTYGTAERTGAAAQPRLHYVRVWRVGTGGAWRLAVDAMAH